MVAFYPIVTGPLAENCYLLWEGASAWIIDPGADDDAILAELSARDLTPCAIVLTHGHFDHVGALDALVKHFPDIPVVLHDADAAWAFTHPFNQYPPFYLHQKRPATLLAPGESLMIGGMTARVLHTPGHTPGSCCFVVERPGEAPLCFTGDTLFKGSVGRTDLPGGSFLELNRSLARLVQTLPPETTVLSGHGDASTMAIELRTNPYLREDEGF